MVIEEVKKAKKKLTGDWAKKGLLEFTLATEKDNNKQAEKDLNDLLKARQIVQIVAEKTQEKIEYHISNLVSMALASIWDDPYTFKLRFVQRRNKTECDLIFERNGYEIDDILNVGGGGVADIASHILQLALWSIKKTRNVMIWDEPTKFLHNPIYQQKASELFKTLCKELKLQIIIISDQQNIINSADKTFLIENINGIANVKEIINDVI